MIHTAIAAGWSRRQALERRLAAKPSPCSRSGRGGIGAQTLWVPATFDELLAEAPPPRSGASPGIRAGPPGRRVDDELHQPEREVERPLVRLDVLDPVEGDEREDEEAASRGRGRGRAPGSRSATGDTGDTGSATAEDGEHEDAGDVRRPGTGDSSATSGDATRPHRRHHDRAPDRPPHREDAAVERLRGSAPSRSMSVPTFVRPVYGGMPATMSRCTATTRRDRAEVAAGLGGRGPLPSLRRPR